MSEQNYFLGKINDLIRREERGESMVFSSFLTAEEAADAAAICKKAHAPFTLFGGYEDAERKILAISEFDEDTLRICYPISVLSIDTFEPRKLTNRDILGALMSTGIRRDCLGDIIARKGTLLFFAASHIAPFLIENVTSIGRQSVKLTELTDEYSIPEPEFCALRLTVASMRLDAVIAALATISREQACRLIEIGSVFLNHIPINKKTKEVLEGDCIVIRGKGKWIVDSCNMITKKGRTVLECRKYI